MTLLWCTHKNRCLSFVFELGSLIPFLTAITVTLSATPKNIEITYTVCLIKLIFGLTVKSR